MKSTMVVATFVIGLVCYASATSIPASILWERISAADVVVRGRVRDAYRMPKLDHGVLVVDSVLVWNVSTRAAARWRKGAKVSVIGHGVGAIGEELGLFFLQDVSGHAATLRLGDWPIALEDPEVLKRTVDELYDHKRRGADTLNVTAVPKVRAYLRKVWRSL